MNREVIIIAILTVLAPRPYYSHFSHIFVKASVVKIISLMMCLAFQNELQRKTRPAQGVLKPADAHSAFPLEHGATGTNLTCRSQLPQCQKCCCIDWGTPPNAMEAPRIPHIHRSAMRIYILLLDPWLEYCNIFPACRKDNFVFTLTFITYLVLLVFIK